MGHAQAALYKRAACWHCFARPPADCLDSRLPLPPPLPCAAARECGADTRRLHFLDMPFYRNAAGAAELAMQACLCKADTKGLVLSPQHALMPYAHVHTHAPPPAGLQARWSRTRWGGRMSTRWRGSLSLCAPTRSTPPVISRTLTARIACACRWARRGGGGASVAAPCPAWEARPAWKPAMHCCKLADTSQFSAAAPLGTGHLCRAGGGATAGLVRRVRHRGLPLPWRCGGRPCPHTQLPASALRCLGHTLLPSLPPANLQPGRSGSPMRRTWWCRCRRRSCSKRWALGRGSQSAAGLQALSLGSLHRKQSHPAIMCACRWTPFSSIRARCVLWGAKGFGEAGCPECQGHGARKPACIAVLSPLTAPELS